MLFVQFVVFEIAYPLTHPQTYTNDTNVHKNTLTLLKACGGGAQRCLSFQVSAFLAEPTCHVLKITAFVFHVLSARVCLHVSVCTYLHVSARVNMRTCVWCASVEMRL